jgi:hypothetical protein
MVNVSNPILTSTSNVVGQSGMAVALTGSTAETTLASAVIPQGLMQAHGRIRLWFTTTATNNANAKTIKAKINGNVIGAAVSIASSATQVFHVDVVNGSHLGANFGQVQMVAASGTTQTGAALNIDMTQPLTVTITGQLGTSTDTITLQAYSLETLNV